MAVDVFQNDNEVVVQSIVAGVKPDDWILHRQRFCHNKREKRK